MMRKLMNKVETLLIVALAVILLGACGQKGPLYLPEEQPVASAQDSDDESEDDNSEDDNKEEGSTE